MLGSTSVRHWRYDSLSLFVRVFCTHRPLTATVGGVVSDANFLSDPSGTAMAHWVRSNCINAANGSVMRTSPVGVIGLNSTEEETFEHAICMGAITHSDPRCAISVAVVSGLIRGICAGEVQTEADVDALLERAWAHVADAFSEHPFERQEFDKHAFATSLDALVLSDRQMGYVYKCLGSALWCLRQVLRGQHDFRSAMVELVMCGGDADTNGAVAGALMGAHCGYEGLPSEWRDGLRHRDWYMEKIEALFVVVGLKQGTYDAESDPDTTLDGGKGFLSDEEMDKRVQVIMEKIRAAGNQRPVLKKTWWKFW